MRLTLKPFKLKESCGLKAVIIALMLALSISASGCGEKKDENVTIIGGADGPTSIFLAKDTGAVNQKDILSGTWQTASIGYEMNGEMQPEYIVQAETSSGIQYTLKTAESDNDVLEYYETWNEKEFGDTYRGGSSLSRCN